MVGATNSGHTVSLSTHETREGACPVSWPNLPRIFFTSHEVGGGGGEERKKGKKGNHSSRVRVTFSGLRSDITARVQGPGCTRHGLQQRAATKNIYIYIHSGSNEGRKEGKKKRGERFRFLERREATMISKRVKGEVSWMDSGGRFEFGGHSRFLELSSARYPLEEEGRGEAARCLVLSSAVDHGYHGYHHGI